MLVSPIGCCLDMISFSHTSIDQSETHSLSMSEHGIFQVETRAGIGREAVVQLRILRSPKKHNCTLFNLALYTNRDKLQF